MNVYSEKINSGFKDLSDDYRELLRENKRLKNELDIIKANYKIVMEHISSLVNDYNTLDQIYKYEIDNYNDDMEEI